jgi:hypothetical protein
METYGLIYNDGQRELESLILDSEGNPRLDAIRPYPLPEDWIDPTLIPVVKIEKPEDGNWNPVVVWFEDRVERQWEQAE